MQDLLDEDQAKANPQPESAIATEEEKAKIESPRKTLKRQRYDDMYY